MADLLRTDYKDDILNTDVNTQRKYRIVENGDGTVSFEDVTEYKQVGDNFGAADINKTNLALTDTNNGVSFKFGIDEKGNYGYIKAGADTVTPFSNPYLKFDAEKGGIYAMRSDGTWELIKSTDTLPLLYYSLYEKGVFSNGFTKDYTFSRTTAYTNSYGLAFYDTYFTAHIAGGQNGVNYAYFLATFSTQIDVTNFSKLIVEAPDNSGIGWNIGLNSSLASGSAVYNSTPNLVSGGDANWVKNSDGTYTFTLDISGVTGNAYFALGSQVVGSATGKFNKVYFK